MIQAGLVLSLVCRLNGADKVGWSYTTQAVKMADRMGLFAAAADKGKHTDERLKSARIFTAWALFSWQRQVAIVDLGHSPTWS